MAGYGRSLRIGSGRWFTARSHYHLLSACPFIVRNYMMIIFVFVCGTFLLSGYLEFKVRFENKRSNRVLQKVILAWTPFFSEAVYLPRTLAGLGCEIDTCVTSHNRSDLNRSEAIIFHWRDLSDLPRTRKSNHQWVLLNYESPHHVNWERSVKRLVSGLNFTATYRLDSDIVAPYGRVRRLNQSADNLNDLREIFKNFKTKKSVVWMVSNCQTPSKRERFVKIMKNYIHIDIYGDCGDVVAPCGRNSTLRLECYKKFAQEYKFYLSFENSLCRDYVTEKLFLPLSVGLIPVVFSGGNYSQILPPDSYIDALAFDTPKELADYLLRVDSNFTLYQRYLKWKADYDIVHFEPSFHWLCELCRLLHKPRHHVINKRDFFEWWFAQGSCHSWETGSSDADYTTKYNSVTVL